MSQGLEKLDNNDRDSNSEKKHGISNVGSQQEESQEQVLKNCAGIAYAGA